MASFRRCQTAPTSRSLEEGQSGVAVLSPNVRKISMKYLLPNQNKPLMTEKASTLLGRIEHLPSQRVVSAGSGFQRIMNLPTKRLSEIKSISTHLQVENKARCCADPATRFSLIKDRENDPAGSSSAAIKTLPTSRIYTWGSNINGECGVGLNEEFISKPTLVGFQSSSPVTCIDTSRCHSLLTTENGELYGWGDNKFGQCHKGSKRSSTPVRAPMLFSPLSDHRIIAVSTGAYHSVALTINGQTFCWGDNKKNQIPVGSNIACVCKPYQILKNEFVLQAACGFTHTIVLNKKFEAIGWGDNSMGQIGLGECCSIYQPTKIDIKNVEIIKCGDFHSLFLTSQRRIASCGSFENGRLGLGEKAIHSTIEPDNPSINEPMYIQLSDIDGENLKDDKAISISAGGSSSFVVFKSGRLYAFGCNKHGQLGLGDTKSRFSPTLVNSLVERNINVYKASVGESHSIILSTAQNIYFMGKRIGNNFHRSILNPTLWLPVSEKKNYEFMDVITGGHHSFVFAIENTKTQQHNQAGNEMFPGNCELNIMSTSAFVNEWVCVCTLLLRDIESKCLRNKTNCIEVEILSQNCSANDSVLTSPPKQTVCDKEDGKYEINLLFSNFGIFSAVIRVSAGDNSKPNLLQKSTIIDVYPSIMESFQWKLNGPGLNCGIIREPSVFYIKLICTNALLFEKYCSQFQFNLSFSTPTSTLIDASTTISIIRKGTWKVAYVINKSVDVSLKVSASIIENSGKKIIQNIGSHSYKIDIRNGSFFPLNCFASGRIISESTRICEAKLNHVFAVITRDRSGHRLYSKTLTCQIRLVNQKFSSDENCYYSNKCLQIEDFRNGIYYCKFSCNTIGIWHMHVFLVDKITAVEAEIRNSPFMLEVVKSQVHSKLNIKLRGPGIKHGHTGHKATFTAFVNSNVANEEFDSKCFYLYLEQLGAVSKSVIKSKFNATYNVSKGAFDCEYVMPDIEGYYHLNLHYNNAIDENSYLVSVIDSSSGIFHFKNALRPCQTISNSFHYISPPIFAQTSNKLNPVYASNPSKQKYLETQSGGKVHIAVNAYVDDALRSIVEHAKYFHDEWQLDFPVNSSSREKMIFQAFAMLSSNFLGGIQLPINSGAACVSSSIETNVDPSFALDLLSCNYVSFGNLINAISAGKFRLKNDTSKRQHRAVLMKYLCDNFDLPCGILSNFNVIVTIQLEKLYTIDLLYSPSKLDPYHIEINS